MEYFTVNGEAENLTLQDMIECDIKSEFNEQCGSPEEIDLGLKTRLSEAVSVTDALNMEFSTQTGMDTTCSATLTALASDVDKKNDIGDLAWLQTVNVSDIQAVVVQPSAVHQHHQENSNDANLLVNPQTGVPVIQDPGLHSPHSQSAIAPVTVIQPMSPVAVRVTAIPQTVTTTNALLNSPVNNNNVNVNINRTSFTNSTVSQATLIQPQVTRVYQHPLTAQQLLASAKQQRLRTEPHVEEKVYPKPVYSYSCLIAMALKNSETGALPVSEIYSFMTENFPYFKTAPDGWKNSVRHNLSLNKCFEKIENPKANGNTRKGCLWGLNPEKIEKMDEEITKWRKKDPTSVKRAMAKPEVLEMLEMGRLGSNSPRHPNNIKNMKNNNHLAGRLQQQQQQHQQQHLIPESPSKVLDTPMDTTTPLTTTSIINITPASTGTVVKMEPQVVHIVNTPDSLDTKSGMRNFTIKTEDTGSGVATGEVDLNILDTGLSMESQLPDLQGNLWDELGAEGINLDDLAASSLNFSFASVSSGNGSPITVQSATGVNASPLVTLLTNRTVPSSPATIPISSRTLFAAQT